MIKTWMPGTTPGTGRSQGEPSMATVSIDSDLLERALKVSGERMKRAVVTKALEEFISSRQQKRLLELIGTLEWDDTFNYKAERSRSS